MITSWDWNLSPRGALKVSSRVTRQAWEEARLWRLTHLGLNLGSVVAFLCDLGKVSESL